MATLDVEDENILATIFKDAFPENWQDNPDFAKYLAELSSFGLGKLSREPDRLAEERSQILEQTQELAFDNYKTFIQTAECSREIYEDFQIIEKHVGAMLEKLPGFSEECNHFMKTAQEISTNRKTNTLTLHRHTQLLEILEIPQLMDTCVRNGYYDEALELSAHVKRLEKKHSGIPVIQNIVSEVKSSCQLMLNQLIQQLRTSLQLPACLRVIGYLRRMDVFTEVQLRIKFLQARDTWFQGILSSIPTTDAYTHITKTVEMSRVHLFDIITQYRAIFSDEDPLLSTSNDDTPIEGALFSGWVVHKVTQFLKTLQHDLELGVGGRLDSVLGQCMYFGLSFSRVGADFRGLLAPIFQQSALKTFEESLKDATKKFEEAMLTFTLLSQHAMHAGTSLSSYGMSQSGSLQPPMSLLDFPPLAIYCNGILAAFNDLRLCAPISLADSVATRLQESLTKVVSIMISFHRTEEGAFNQQEQEMFATFCKVVADDFLPFLNRCLQALFPASQIALVLGVSVIELAKMGNLGTIDTNAVIKPLEHLLPAKVEDVTESTIGHKPTFTLDTDSADESTPSLQIPDVKPSEVKLETDIGQNVERTTTSDGVEDSSYNAIEVERKNSASEIDRDDSVKEKTENDQNNETRDVQLGDSNVITNSENLLATDQKRIAMDSIPSVEDVKPMSEVIQSATLTVASPDVSLESGPSASPQPSLASPLLSVIPSLPSTSNPLNTSTEGAQAFTAAYQIPPEIQRLLDQASSPTGGAS